MSTQVFTSVVTKIFELFVHLLVGLFTFLSNNSICLLIVTVSVQLFMSYSESFIGLILSSIIFSAPYCVIIKFSSS